LVLPASPGAEGAEAAATAFAQLTGIQLELSGATASQDYEFGPASGLWPFSGLTLREELTRSVPGVKPNEHVEALVRNDAGTVFLRMKGRRAGVFLSLVPAPVAEDVRFLKDEFRPGRFMGLTPLLVFARTALGEAGWRSRKLSAAFLVDDPNLRFRRYGFLSLEGILEASREEDLHLSIAMIPLDYRKSRAHATALIRDNRERLSVVYHGVDHRKSEFESDATPLEAQRSLAQAIARMEEHRRRTGVDHAPVMTFPHGDCSAVWLRAMRDAGLDAALASRALPFAHDTGLGNALYELFPAELGFAGFPMINRFKCEDPPEQLLFQAWLGKPLIIYTHHEYFADGLERTLGIARYLNRHVSPAWRDIGSIAAENYQYRTGAEGTVVRTFSNRISLPPELRAAAVLKPAPAVPPDECARVDGAPADLTLLPEGAAVLDLPGSPRAIEVWFGPSAPRRDSRVRRISAVSRARRTVTELRDHGAPLVSRLRGGER
jgi:hypothetical protein